MSNEITPAAPKCDAAKVLGNTINQLLIAAPANPIARAHAMSRIKREIPLEIVEYESIKNWIEENIEASVAPSEAKSISAGGRRNTLEAFTIDVSYSELESGTCTYTCRRSGGTDYSINQAEILAAVSSSIERGESLERVLESLEEDINANAYARMDLDSVDYNYDDEEANDSEDKQTEFSSRRLAEMTRDWLLNNHPELLEQLDENE